MFLNDIMENNQNISTCERLEISNCYIDKATLVKFKEFCAKTRKLSDINLSKCKMADVIRFGTIPISIPLEQISCKDACWSCSNQSDFMSCGQMMICGCFNKGPRKVPQESIEKALVYSF